MTCCFIKKALQFEKKAKQMISSSGSIWTLDTCRSPYPCSSRLPCEPESSDPATSSKIDASSLNLPMNWQQPTDVWTCLWWRVIRIWRVTVAVKQDSYSAIPSPVSCLVCAQSRLCFHTKALHRVNQKDAVGGDRLKSPALNPKQ